MVALLAEGVDRNLYCGCHCLDLQRSPSSRRAWIEISSVRSSTGSRVVALLAEGVDRNAKNGNQVDVQHVALLAEGVDRNSAPVEVEERGQVSPSSRRAWIEIGYSSSAATSGYCRPPRGGRG